MKVLLVLSLFVAVAFAGVGRLSRQQEDDILALYRLKCSSEWASGGSHGGAKVYCKFPLDAPQEIRKEHEIRADGAGTNSKQIVFVRPQSNIYRHHLTLTGTSEHNRETNIYVLPQKDQHEIAVKDQRLAISKGDKPHLYYLTRDPLGNDEIRPEVSRSPIVSTVRDEWKSRPVSRSSVVSSDLDARGFRQSFRSSRTAPSFNDDGLRQSFSNSPISSSSGAARITYTKVN